MFPLKANLPTSRFPASSAVGGFIFGLAAIKPFANRRHGRGAGPPDPVY